MRVTAMIGLAAALALGCGTARPPPVANATRTQTRDLPDGWLRFHPDAGRLACAQWSNQRWQRARSHGAIEIAEPAVRESDTGPELPFTPASIPEPRGRRHTLAVADGSLVGYDAGEWGGSLHWYARDGSQHAQLATRNVHGLVAFGPDEVVALEGLNHMSLRDGNARWLERVHGAWRVGTLARLDAGPVTYATDRDTIYVVTATSLTRIGRDRRAVVVHPLPKLGTQASSMVMDDSGRLWIGMRQLVLRLTRMGERFEAEWLVHASCRHAARRDLDCVCVGG